MVAGGQMKGVTRYIVFCVDRLPQDAEMLFYDILSISKIRNNKIFKMCFRN